ncbi:hypothetical protein J6590_094645 [Homalodisca vitripennis]|nr:hypothetical protein J6590_094645 [Homalodisca vitripennis]
MSLSNVIRSPCPGRPCMPCDISYGLHWTWPVRRARAAVGAAGRGLRALPNNALDVTDDDGCFCGLWLNFDPQFAVECING